MKHTWCIFFIVFLVLCVSGCQDHDDARSQEYLSKAVQVTVVFYPGQVGDHGYADDLMEHVPQIGRLGGADNTYDIDTQFFAYDSRRETLNALRYWASHSENPFLGGRYQQRLLVLTDAREVAWLDSLMIENESDHLLLLNTAEGVVDSLAMSWGDRVHALNVSITKEVATMCQYILRSKDAGGENEEPEEVNVYRLAGSYNTADSIGIVCQSVLSHDMKVCTKYMNELQEDSVSGKISYVQSLQYARFLADFYYKYNKDEFLFIDGGSYNIVFDDLSPKEAGMARTIFIDLNMGTDNYCIRRQYGKALVDWISDWFRSASPTDMPCVRWHGSWDGYVDSNIPPIP